MTILRAVLLASAWTWIILLTFVKWIEPRQQTKPKEKP